MPGRIALEVAEMLRRHLRERPLVVWYDGEGAYETLVNDLPLEGVSIFKLLPAGPPPKLRASFFRLRHQLDPFIENLGHGKAIAYVRINRGATFDALVEADNVGVAIYPKATSIVRNMSLAVIARRALKGHVQDAALDELCGKAERGTITADQLDRLELQGRHRARPHLAAVLGSLEPNEIALRFLADASVDASLEADEVRVELLSLLGDVYGLEAAGIAPSGLRHAFTIHALLTDLVGSVSEGDRLPNVSAAPIAKMRDSLEACRELARRWRDSEERRASYIAAAARVEAVWPIRVLKLAPGLLVESDTFRGVDLALLEEAERRLASSDPGETRGWAAARSGRFWWRNDPELAIRWSMVEAAARLLDVATRIEAGLVGRRLSTTDLVTLYTGPNREGAWCQLDRSHRIVMRLAGAVEAAGFETALLTVRRRYEHVAGLLAEAAHAALLRDATAPATNLQQQAVFVRDVRPSLEEGRVAYVMVDALRYEMALDLVEGLPGKAHLRHALAVVPSITPLGMAALLPGAEQRLEVAEKGGQLVAVIAGEAMKDRAQRLAYVRRVLGDEVADAKLQDLHGGRKVPPKVKNAKLLLVTSQEIDKFGESDHEPIARRTMDEVLGDIRRAIHLLARWGFDHVVVSADHGYLFGDRVGEERIIPAPEGEELDLHRRVWIGRGGATPVDALRLPVTAFGVSGDYDVVLPPGLSVFRAGGSLAYFHGGASLQERVIPVLKVKLPVGGAAQTSGESVNIQIDRERGVRSRAWSVGLVFRSLLRPEGRARVVARHAGRVVGVAMAAERGFDAGTQEVTLATDTSNVVTLVLIADVDGLDIEVRDAQSDQLLGSVVNVPVRLGV